MTTFLLLCICFFLIAKSWAASNVPAATPEEQRLRAEREAARQKQVLSLIGTTIAWLFGKWFSARKGKV
jgi:predicted MFS family arabinose efflux permease